MDLKNPNTYTAASALAITLAATGFLYVQIKSTHSEVEDLKTKISALMKDASKNRPLSNQIQQLGVVALNLDKGLNEMENTINTIIKKQSDQDAINLNLLQVVDELVKLNLTHEFKHDINHNLRSAIASRKKSGQRKKNSKSNRRKSRRSYSSESDTESESESSSDSYDSYESETESESSDEPNYSRNSKKRETSKRSSSSSYGSSGNRKKSINQSTSRHRLDERSQRYKNVSNGSTHGKHNPKKNKRFKQSRRVRNKTKVVSSEEGSDLDDIIADVDGS